MGKGKYQSKQQANWPMIVLCLLVVAIVILAAVLLKSCGGEQPDSGSTKPAVTNPIQETTQPEPSETEPTEPEPSETEPTEPEPSETEPTEPEPSVTEPTEPEPTEPVANQAGEVAKLALSLEGKPERSPEHPDGFDVGSLITYCFRQCGFSDVPGDFNSLLTYGTEVEQGQDGDVVIFRITPQEGASYDYIGIVVEGDQFIAVSSSSGMVIKRPLSYFSSYPTVYRRFTEPQQ